MKFEGKTKEYLVLDTIESKNFNILNEVIESSLSILWFESNDNILIIDGNSCVFNKNEIVFLTEFHKLKIVSVNKIRFIRFNR
ncbi:MAG: AraC family transcriptional regulator, partial [Bacteroidetes bacterium HGW-Bacteroidetes-18]